MVACQAQHSACSHIPNETPSRPKHLTCLLRQWTITLIPTCWHLLYLQSIFKVVNQNVIKLRGYNYCGSGTFASCTITPKSKQRQPITYTCSTHDLYVWVQIIHSIHFAEHILSILGTSSSAVAPSMQVGLIHHWNGAQFSINLGVGPYKFCGINLT